MGILDKHPWAILSTNGHSWTLMSTEEYGVNTLWVILGPWCHAHKAHYHPWVLLAPCPWVHAHFCLKVVISANECSWATISTHDCCDMSTHGYKWALMGTLEHSWVFMNSHELSCARMRAHECSLGLKSAHESSCPFISMGPCCHVSSWAFKNAHITMAPFS